VKKFVVTACGVIVFGLIGCTKHEPQGAASQQVSQADTPAELVEEFVRLSVASTAAADRLRLRDMCKGKLRDAFDKMSPDNFQMSYLSGGIAIENFEILSAKVDGVDAVVHYKVKIQNRQGSQHTSENNERAVSLVRIGESWFLDSIRPTGKDEIAFVNGMMF
jgi:hypothetical protein